MDLRCLRERKLPPGYFLKLRHGQLISSHNDNNQSDPFTTTSSTRLQDRLRIRLRRSLQQFLATRLKPGRRRAKEHNHRIHLTLNEYNYLKNIGIKSQFTPQTSFFASLNCIVNLVYGEYKDKVCYVSDFHCKVRKSNSVTVETENGDKSKIDGDYFLYMKILRAERDRCID
ncbi:unnamed protein product [Didymodactylos carnosus]|uniref:Uncharacterized protein n=1 Tax=Didymodactylos carnosus TaxID=1234261 RepID=A0A814U8K8_9BILA|nr:unnamed protein product [Didymodactylos carnosus]CAF3934988.1 unnamed protein product [Didymodactylos carnosus]